MEQKSWIIDVKEDENGDCFIELGYQILDQLDWKVGDELEWIDNHNGTWSIVKKEDKENGI